MKTILFLAFIVSGCFFSSSDDIEELIIAVNSELSGKFSVEDTLVIEGDFSKITKDEIVVTLGDHEMTILKLNDSTIRIILSELPCSTCSSVCGILTISEKGSKESLFESAKEICFEPVSAPKAEAVTVEGSPVLDSTLKSKYTYLDDQDDKEGESIYKWYRDSILLNESTELSYIVTEADLGHSLIFEVIPVALTGILLKGEPVRVTLAIPMVNPDSSKDSVGKKVIKPDYEPGTAPGDTTLWLLRVTGLRTGESFGALRTNELDSGEVFAIRYRHYSSGLGQSAVEFSYVGETADDVIDRSPTLKISIDSGTADYGRDNDLEWEGIDIPSLRYFGIDADASGLGKDRSAGAKDWKASDKSMNLQYHTASNRVRITDKSASLSADFDLFTGVISGDAEITKGFTSLEDYFAASDDRPFTDTVSDASGYCAVVGIFADYRTVALHECGKPGAPPDTIPPWDVPAIPDSIDPPEPPDPPKEGEEGQEEDREEFKKEEYQIPITGSSKTPETSVPKITGGIVFPQNLGEIDNPRQHKVALTHLTFEKTAMEKVHAHFEKFLKPAIDKLNSEDNKRFAEYAASKGAHVPTRQEVIDMLTTELGFNPLDPCADLDEMAPDFGMKLIGRMLQLLKLYNIKATTFLSAGDEGFSVSQQAAGLAESEAAWYFLKFFGDALSWGSSKAVDIVSAGGLKAFLKDLLQPAIDKIIKDNAVGNLKEALDTEAKVNEFIDNLVDDLPWTDVDKNAFKKALKNNFAGDPENIADPTAWIKVFFETFFGLASSLAQSQIDGINDLKKQGKASLSEGLMALHKARFILETLMELQGKLKDICADKIKEIDQVKAHLQAATADYLEIKGKMLDVLESILNDIQAVNQIMQDQPSTEEIKERVKQVLANCISQISGVNIQELGEIDFDVTITATRDQDGNVINWTWEVSGFQWVLPLQQ